MTIPCRACAGINSAVHHLTLTPFDQEAILSVCPSCLEDAPSWAGWATWPQHMKEQRIVLLRGLSATQEHAETIMEGVTA